MLDRRQCCLVRRRHIVQPIDEVSQLICHDAALYAMKKLYRSSFDARQVRPQSLPGLFPGRFIVNRESAPLRAGMDKACANPKAATAERRAGARSGGTALYRRHMDAVCTGYAHESARLSDRPRGDADFIDPVEKSFLTSRLPGRMLGEIATCRRHSGPLPASCGCGAFCVCARKEDHETRRRNRHSPVPFRRL